MGLIQYIGRKLSDGANYLGAKVRDGLNYVAAKAPVIQTFMDRAGGIVHQAKNFLASPTGQQFMGKYAPAANLITKGLSVAERALNLGRSQQAQNLINNFVQSRQPPASARNDRAELEAKVVPSPEAMVMDGYGEDLD